MKKVLAVAIVFICVTVVFMATNEQQQGLKVFISVDMEGLSGVVKSSELGAGGADYGHFREIMAKETNAAIEGAINAGATEIVVRDSHGSGRNILPGYLHEKAKLLRDWSGGPKGMMEGIDETFDAAIFIGYHAKANTPDAVIDHTMSGNVADISINGISMPEAGINALIAGVYDVPMVFASGDRALCEQAKELFGEIELFSTKDGIGDAAELGLHPSVSCEHIRKGVEKALKNLDKYKPYKLQAPFTMNLKVRREKDEVFPGAAKVREGEFTFTSDDIMLVIEAFSKLR
ncbi:M55 family metallopeptidase [candidate division KSB1 bacterium]